VKLKANLANLNKYARELLGNEWTEERQALLVNECIKGFARGHGHVSHDRQAHLERIDKILGTCGVEGMLLDRNGNDMAGECSMRDVLADIQYCNAGDTYAMTVFYYNGTLCIGDWGSIVERLA
jgi:hypothetical protein